MDLAVSLRAALAAMPLPSSPAVWALAAACALLLVASGYAVGRAARHRAAGEADDGRSTAAAARLLSAEAFARHVDAALARPGARHAAVACLAVDDFALAESTLGPALAETLLEEFAARLLDGVRRGDAVARLPGSRFAVMLRDPPTADAATALVRRLLDALHQPCEAQGASVVLRFGAGVALAPAHARRSAELLAQAAWALDADGAARRGAVVAYLPEAAARSRRRAQIAERLSEAVARDEIGLRLQPRAALASLTLIGFEARAHWRHPELGDVAEAEWAPIAREAGLLPALGDALLRRAAAAARDWPRDAAGCAADLRLSLCFDATHLAQLQADGGLGARLDALQLPHRRFEAQVPADALGAAAASTETLLGWRAAGVRIALDGFGSAEASLSQLRAFRFDAVTLDPAFVRKQTGPKAQREVVDTVLALVDSLAVEAVADGVDSPAQAALLQRTGCTAVQGRWVAPPLPADSVAAFVAGWPRRAEALRARKTAPAAASAPGRETAPRRELLSPNAGA